MENEKLSLLNLIESPNFNETSTPEFWTRNKKLMPKLSELALILFNIPASADFIERYYSLCGNICKNRCGNMTPQVIIQRSFLKSNIKILNKLTLTDA